MMAAARVPPEKAVATDFMPNSAADWLATVERSCSKRVSRAAPVGSGSAATAVGTVAAEDVAGADAAAAGSLEA